MAFPGPAVYPFYSASQSNTCNIYIPNDATLSRCAQCLPQPSRTCLRCPPQAAWRQSNILEGLRRSTW